jgi:hypothetical protein
MYTVGSEQGEMSFVYVYYTDRVHKLSLIFKSVAVLHTNYTI